MVLLNILEPKEEGENETKRLSSYLKDLVHLS